MTTDCSVWSPADPHGLSEVGGSFLLLLVFLYLHFPLLDSPFSPLILSEVGLPDVSGWLLYPHAAAFFPFPDTVNQERLLPAQVHSAAKVVAVSISILYHAL